MRRSLGNTMTLVVSEVTRFGIAMVGDSAVTVTNPGPARVITGAAKVQYSPATNIGFAIWGAACVAGERMDVWLSSFIGRIEPGLPLDSVAERLAQELNSGIDRGKQSGDRRGIHVAGYVNGLPHLYHLHTGNEGEPQHELRVFKDFPYVHVPSVSEYEHRIKHIGGYQLRSGYHGMFGLLFDSMYRYTETLKQLQFRWPDGGIEDRVQLYQLLIGLLSDTLVAEGRLPAVGGGITAIAFTSDGLVVDQAGTPGAADFPCGHNAEFGYCVA